MTEPTNQSGMPSWLRAILRCPACRAELANAPDELVCTSPDCGLRYRVQDAIPVLLVDQARPRQS